MFLITAPHTQDTHHMIDARMLDRMKRGAGLINYSRAHLVDYEALCRKLERGELTAVLDVFDPEPLPAGFAALACAQSPYHTAFLLGRCQPIHA